MNRGDALDVAGALLTRRAKVCLARAVAAGIVLSSALGLDWHVAAIEWFAEIRAEQLQDAVDGLVQDVATPPASAPPGR